MNKAPHARAEIILLPKDDASATTLTVASLRDLSSGIIHLVHWHQYGEAATLDITEEMAKETKPTRIRTLFSPATVKQAEAEHSDYKRAEAK